MTPTKPQRTCPECQYDGGWHYDAAGNAHRCPNYVSAEILTQARELSAKAHEKAFDRAKAIIQETAEHCQELSGNATREQMESHDIPGPVVGAAFNWAASQGATPGGPLIEATGRYVQSTDPATRHRIVIWRSRVHAKTGGDAA